ncbi:hypothetical protein FA95DRAFT_1684702 [Auriscalpium vulgare]|uniref:Uncharacterized protein n=1 Tax=Auriscalpium vulgare TaxID=40419 RepID=A0ACB8R3Q3_9AGAM|nr:hypothetical protein FA95DRAFT_1684702 [Auriscalpium vulgare]
MSTMPGLALLPRAYQDMLQSPLPFLYSLLAALWAALARYLQFPAERVPALHDLQTGDILGLMDWRLIGPIRVVVTPKALTNGIVETSFDLYNPLPFEISIDHVTTYAGVNDSIYAQFSQPFSGFVVPPHSTVNSGTFGGVKLVQGAINTLPIVNAGSLDIYKADIRVRLWTRNGKMGLPLPLNGVRQGGIQTKYDINLGPSGSFITSE